MKNVADASALHNDVLVFCTDDPLRTKRETDLRGIRVEKVPSAANGRPDIHAVLRRLGQLEITSVMIEGGSAVNGAMLSAGVVDKVFFYYAPKIMARTGAVPFSSGAADDQMDEIPPLRSLRLHRFDEDFAVEGYLRDPYND